MRTRTRLLAVVTLVAVFLASSAVLCVHAADQPVVARVQAVQ